MAKINTLNYQTVASWNGSQDLLIIEQPDGTKVATPAMVKQFIEAGDFEATGEVKDGNGNILSDMAKSADVDAEIGDLSQTGLTGDSVAEQLDTVRERLIKTKEATIGPSTDGHFAPIQSGGGVYYERLANFSALGVDPSKIISIELIGWGDITHSFTLYTTSTTLSCMSDNSSSIYRQSTSELTIRITYKGI